MDLTTHYLDTNVLVDYIESDPKENAYIWTYRQCTLFRRYTSTTPYEEYRNLCGRVGKHISRFLNQALKDPSFKQPKNLKGQLSHLFQQYSSNNIDKYETSYVKKRVRSFVGDVIPKIADAYKNGQDLSQILKKCIQKVQNLVYTLRSILAKICYDGDDARIRLCAVTRTDRVKITTAQSSSNFFNKIKKENKQDCKVLAEACQVKREINVDTLCLITRDNSHFLKISERIRRNLNGICPCHPARILAIHGI